MKVSRKEYLKFKELVETHSVGDIAKIYGYSRMGMWQFLQRLGIKTKKRSYPCLTIGCTKIMISQRGLSHRKYCKNCTNYLSKPNHRKMIRKHMEKPTCEVCNTEKAIRTYKRKFACQACYKKLNSLSSGEYYRRVVKPNPVLYKIHLLRNLKYQRSRKNI